MKITILSSFIGLTFSTLHASPGMWADGTVPKRPPPANVPGASLVTVRLPDPDKPFSLQITLPVVAPDTVRPEKSVDKSTAEFATMIDPPNAKRGTREFHAWPLAKIQLWDNSNPGIR